MIEQKASSAECKDVQVSFEFFPPKNPAMESALWSAVERLAPLSPRFMSVTYGAGGSTREKTHSLVARLIEKTDIPAAAHLTCVSASREEVNAVAHSYWQAGVRHIVALRGDPPNQGEKFQTHPDGYGSAVDLVTGLKQVADFEISVAAYPETHPEALSPQADLNHLRRKVDAGAVRAITQFFFDPDVFLRFRDQVSAQKINIELVPGILPIGSFERTRHMAQMCGTRIPAWIENLFTPDVISHPETNQMVSMGVALNLCQYLQKHGVHDVHFYTLNRAELSYAICRMLGVGVHTTKET